MVCFSRFERDSDVIGTLQKAERTLMPVIIQAGVADKALFELEKDERDEAGGAVISLNVDGRPLRLRLNIKAAARCDFQEVAAMIPQRICEFRKHAARFDERIEPVRAKVEARIDRAGHGMRLVSFGMEPLDVRQAFHWYEQRLEAQIEMLDHTLAPEIVPLRSYTYRRFAAGIAHLQPLQRRRAAMAARLAEQHAVLEVDTLTEALITHLGQTLPAIAAQVLRTRGSIGVAAPDVAASAGSAGQFHFSNADGRLVVSGYISPAGPRAFLYGNSLTIDEGIDEDLLSDLKGKALSAFITHPASDKARIATSRVSGDKRTTRVNLRTRRRMIGLGEIDAAA
jgi:hypothetical protein